MSWLVFGPAIAKTGTLRIERGNNLDQVQQQLEDSFAMKRGWLFRNLASLMGYREVKPLRIPLEKGASLFEVIRSLRRNARQTVNVVVLPGHERRQLARQLSRQLALGYAELDSALQDSGFLASYGVTPNSFHRIVVPNTYNLYYACRKEELFSQLSRFAGSYWSAKGLRNTEVDTVLTLASIVEKETTHAEEKARIAGVYLNRLRIRMKLQADPTVNFAIDAWRALSHDDLKVVSPYNTYENVGLPPGPICIPGPASVQAVLEPEQHAFLYFVAKGDGSGVHRFAADFNGHLANIRLRKQELAAGK